ncbi:VOC family protein [Georgenia subflava]|uniref:VOC family protein n=1 Tax=Georgenia subflava TaxID=1622177 RepID=A0A6N7EJ80_9MICO|nr:VOC family protein [Georgenia subflava]MPV36246.1 VOC family protein [Georgenia subflava]
MPQLSLSATVLDARDPRGLAHFYRDLLDWPVSTDEDGWVMQRDPAGGAGLSFQREQLHVAPTWPAEDGREQMQLHLDIHVDDLETAVARAVALGARLASFQPQEHVRVMLDPEGHPFCLFVE